MPEKRLQKTREAYPAPPEPLSAQHEHYWLRYDGRRDAYVCECGATIKAYELARLARSGR